MLRTPKLNIRPNQSVHRLRRRFRRNAW